MYCKEQSAKLKQRQNWFCIKTPNFRLANIFAYVTSIVPALRAGIIHNE